MTEIRKALPEDAEAILAYCRQAGGESDNLTFGPEGVAMTVEGEQAYLESILHSDKQLYLVAVQDGQIVGTGIFASFPKARLAHRGEFSLSVKRALWGSGIGTRLMEAILAFARDAAKVRIISLEVRSDNERAIALYRKFGFETVGTFDGFLHINGQDVSCDIMRLHL